MELLREWGNFGRGNFCRITWQIGDLQRLGKRDRGGGEGPWMVEEEDEAGVGDGGRNLPRGSQTVVGGIAWLEEARCRAEDGGEGWRWGERWWWRRIVRSVEGNGGGTTIQWRRRRPVAATAAVAKGRLRVSST